jgi:hypothetical protein
MSSNKYLIRSDVMSLGDFISALSESPPASLGYNSISKLNKL